MHRQELLDSLDVYAKTWARGLFPHASFDPSEEEQIIGIFRTFIASSPRCFERELDVGHVTGSAMVVSPALDQVLLTLHRKLGLWLQLGGHADSQPSPHDVAMREAMEESGLEELSFFSYERHLRSADAPPLPFDFDFHHIPAHKSEPAHIHYDVRYIIVADPTQPLVISAESSDLRWFTMAEARAVSIGRSMHRQFDKIDAFRIGLSS